MTEKEAIEKSIGVWETRLENKGLSGLCEPATTLIEYLLQTYSVDSNVLNRTIRAFEEHLPK